MNAFAAAEQNGKAADLQQELEALFERQNKSTVNGAHVDSGDVPARHRHRLSATRRFRDSPLDDIGGAPAIRAALDAFYHRVLGRMNQKSR